MLPNSAPASVHIGRCIYCGSQHDLSDEHVIPEGLGGRSVLFKASCEACRVETCKFENHVMRDMIRVIRIRLHIKGKRKHPSTIKMLVHRADGSAALEEINAEDVHISGLLPSYTPPGILIGAPRNELRAGSVTLYGSAENVNKLAQQGIVGLSAQTIRIIDFTRMLAKIAHAEAVRVLGPESFEAFLPELILKRKSAIYYYVGAQAPAQPDGSSEASSWVELRFLTRENENLLVARVRILAPLPEAPTYQIVIGRVSNQIVSDWLGRLNPDQVCGA